jgi:proline dehydrogenase
MIDAWSRRFFESLAGSSLLRSLARRYGLPAGGGLARRFIAGETVEEAIAAARAVEGQGLLQTLDLLGERVGTEAEALAATDAYLSILPPIVAADIGRTISIKLTQIGLGIDQDLCLHNLRAILASARDDGFFVRIDMEASPYAGPTLDVFTQVWADGLTNVGVVLQAALKRSEADLHQLLSLGARVRLVKGAYNEPADVAYQTRDEVDAAFLRMLPLILSRGALPAIATHDPALIDATRRIAAETGLAADRFEFQMLYGVRRDLQAALAADGYRMRVCIPFGHDWFRYIMRRLGERPANVVVAMRSLVGER